jgi:hypothetical protein
MTTPTEEEEEEDITAVRKVNYSTIAIIEER